MLFGKSLHFLDGSRVRALKLGESNNRLCLPKEDGKPSETDEKKASWQHWFRMFCANYQNAKSENPIKPQPYIFHMFCPNFQNAKSANPKTSTQNTLQQDDGEEQTECAKCKRWFPRKSMTQRSAHTHNCKDCRSLAAFVCKLDFPEELALCNLDKAEQVRFFQDANTFKVGGKLELSSIRTWYERYLTATYERWSAQKRRSIMKPLSVWAGEGYKTAGIEKNAECEWDETLEEYTYALPVKEKEVGELQRRATQEAMKIVRRGRKTRGDAAAAAAALPPQDGSLVPSGGAADQAPSGGAAEPAAGAADMANFMDLVSSSSEAEKKYQGQGKAKAQEGEKEPGGRKQQGRCSREEKDQGRRASLEAVRRRSHARLWHLGASALCSGGPRCHTAAGGARAAGARPCPGQ